ncbi:MAG: helix-hairpin-helix domain-containing protein [Candidatus Thorarchaeota archaeon]
MSVSTGESMLEYREFPIKKALTLICFTPFLAFETSSIYALTMGSLFTGLSRGEHLYLLGIGLVAAILSLAVLALILDRIRNPTLIIYGFSLPVPILFLVGNLVTLPTNIAPMFSTACVIALFVGLVFTLAATTVFMNQTIVIRYRGRTVALMMGIMLLILLVSNLLALLGYPSWGTNNSIFEIVVIASAAFSLISTPWKWDRHPLAVAEDSKQYFRPTLFVLIAYMLWYFSTQKNIENIFSIAGEHFTSLGLFSGLGMFEPLMLAAGGIVAGLISDIRGRKVGFNFLVLLTGLLAIFGSTFYGIENKEIAPGIYETVVILNAAPLLIFERFVEGFMLVLFVMLIWSEIGSPKTRARRIGAVWSFFIIYMALFWAVQLGAFGWRIPEIVGVYGREFAILLALVASYLTSNVPEILDREVEVEALELNFDDELIEDTVGAFVEADDFESIRSQLDIGDGKIETPEGTIDVMSEDFNKILPFRSIPGVGETMESRLKKAGYKSAAQLAGETPQRLASKVPGLSTDRAKKILSATRKKVKEVLRKFGS